MYDIILGMLKIKVAGVPEHFNLPWHLAIKNKLFESQGVEVEWVNFRGGTGAMIQALSEEKVDVAVVLTEGIFASISKGNKSKIISKYINTPLIWGVFSGIQNPINHYGEIYDKKYAISRFGSGSHLMPQVDALAKKKDLQEEQFFVVNNLEGALSSLSKLQTDVFYWEKYTTKPYVDSGVLKHLGDYVTPWPCFMIVAREEFINTKAEGLKKMLNTIFFTNKQFMHSPTTILDVSKRYNQNYEDVENWFYSTEWATNELISDKLIENVNYTLKKAGIISNYLKRAELIENLFD